MLLRSILLSGVAILPPPPPKKEYRPEAGYCFVNGNGPHLPLPKLVVRGQMTQYFGSGILAPSVWALLSAPVLSAGFGGCLCSPSPGLVATRQQIQHLEGFITERTLGNPVL